MRGTPLLLGALAGILPISLVNNSDPNPGRHRKIHKPVRRYGFTPANINRHTGKPHEHKREIARRLRQQQNKGN